MTPRLNPFEAGPATMKSWLDFSTGLLAGGLEASLMELVKIRASQINGCAFCLDMHTRDARKYGVSDQKIHVLAAWAEAGDVYTERERAALALTEAVTRVADTADPVPDDVWEDAARHYDEQELAALVLSIATINVWNRLNVATRQVAGQEW